MSEAPPSYNAASLKEAKSDLTNVGIGESSGSERTLHIADVFVEFSTLRQWNGNIVIDNGPCLQPGAPIGISMATYKLYKRRWIGLMQLVLVNALFGWNVCQSNPIPAPQSRRY
jgi:hypothetical protein